MLIVALLAGILWLVRRDRIKASPIYLDDFLLGDDNRASKAALVMYAALAVSSYVIIIYAIRGTLSDLIFAAYLGAWVAPTVTKLITAGSHAAQPPPPPPPPKATEDPPPGQQP